MRHKTDPADQTVVNDGSHQADNEDDDDDDVSNFKVDTFFRPYDIPQNETIQKLSVGSKFSMNVWKLRNVFKLLKLFK